MSVLNKLMKRLSGEDEPKVEKKVNAFVSKALTTEAGSRVVKAIVSTPRTDREGDQIVVSGIDLNNYLSNPVVLLQHNSNNIVARCVRIAREGDNLVASAEFPAEGVSDVADKTYRLIQAKMLNAVSIGVLPKSWEFMDDSDPWAGRRFLTSEMLEFSFVTLPANSDAMILERCLELPSIEAMEKEFGESIIPPLDGSTPPAVEGQEAETPAGENIETPPKETAGQPPIEGDNEKAARLRAIEVRRRKLV